MKNLSKIAIFATLLSSAAFAEQLSVNPGVYSPMYKTKGTFNFASVTSEVQITLDNDVSAPDNPPTMTLEYFQAHKYTKVNLVVTAVETDECGSLHVHASYPRTGCANRNAMVPRYNVELVDHSNRVCEDLKENLWEAHVRSGFGWCGTGDSVMELVGNPDE